MRSGWYKLLMSRVITTYWPIVLSVWVVAAWLLHMAAPSWNEIAADGDLAFLPATVPSALGQRALEEAFPGANSRSQLMVVFARERDALEPSDLALAMDFARRLHWMAGKTVWEKSLQLEAAGVRLVVNHSASSEQLSVLREIAIDNLTEAIALEQALADYYAKTEPGMDFQRLPEAYEIRGALLQQLGQTEDATVDLSTAKLLRTQFTALLAPELPAWASAVRDVWSWRSPVVGHKLGSDNSHARLVSIQLGSEFTATSNIAFVNGIEHLARELREQHDQISTDLRAEIAGSAAIGVDMLRASQSGMKTTEIVTVVLVLIILALVYRSPFLVAIPLTSIALSLFVATSVIALLARNPANSQGAGLGVFTTTRIFVVVLLFGAGTDFCLFFLARNRELLRTRLVRTRKQMHRVVGSSWRSVHGALIGSATTTIVGLGLMWFSDFQKFKFSGPVIAISLAITLAVCLTFTPALLSALGQLAFWPFHPGRSAADDAGTGRHNRQNDHSNKYWNALAERIVHNPGLALGITLAVLSIPAIFGVMCIGKVTYDLTEELSDSAPSRRGAKLIGEYFPTRDASPITILVNRTEPFGEDNELREACGRLSESLYTKGVESVRCLTDPLGDYPPGKRMGLFAQDAWRRRVLLGHRITRERFVSSIQDLSRRVARFDVVLHENPFTLSARETLARLQDILRTETALANSPWSGAQFTFSGTTVGITDLRAVTQADQTRIQILVTLGVWLVLVLLLRKPLLSTYLILTVLLSYFATLGVTYWVFAGLYAPSYGGLDWKVPLFLFVILVAVGQDYNVYLVTRILEERRTASWNQAVYHALRMTGGIITSCGLVMAGTFIAMTSPAILLWLGGVLPAGWISTDAPVLRGITELGFALAFGVMLDTLVVRSILVPSFIILVHRPRQFSGIREPALAGS